MQRRRKPKVLRITMFLLLVSLIISGSVFLLFKVFKEKLDISTQQEPQTIVKTDSKLIENDIYLLTESKDANTFTSYIAYPETKIAAIDLPIHEWVMKEESNFYEEMNQTEILLGKDFQAHFNVQTDIKEIDDNILAFILTVEQSVEIADKYKTSNVYMVDLKQEKIITLTDILDISDLEEDEFYLLVEEGLKQDIAIYEKVDLELLRSYLNDPDNVKWTLENDKIKIYFNPLEISSHTEGHSVEIDILDLYTIVKEDYRNLLINEEMQIEIDRIIDELSKPIVRELDPNGKYVALTFDDGPHPVVTPKVLDIMKEYNAFATFYMLGKNAELFPEIAKDVAQAGHEIANHSITHSDLKAITREEVKKEMSESMKQIEEATGVRPKTFRPPYGNYNENVLDFAAETDQSIVLWSVDTRDWQSRNAKAIYDEVRNMTKDRSIVLMHDIHQTTADALPQVMKYLSDEGFEFVTVSELLPLIEGDDVGPYHGNR